MMSELSGQQKRPLIKQANISAQLEGSCVAPLWSHATKSERDLWCIWNTGGQGKFTHSRNRTKLTKTLTHGNKPNRDCQIAGKKSSFWLMWWNWERNRDKSPHGTRSPLSTQAGVEGGVGPSLSGFLNLRGIIAFWILAYQQKLFFFCICFVS